jgi:hypothetical protein
LQFRAAAHARLACGGFGVSVSSNPEAPKQDLRPCCSDDWCNVHTLVQGKVPAVELQECNLTNPAGGTTGCLDCILAGTCTNDSQTLSQVLLLAAQHGTTVQELYLGELLCAFD